MRFTRRSVLLLTAVVAVVLLMVVSGRLFTGGDVLAADINYTTKSYHVKMTAHEDHSVDVEENVRVNFVSDAHGIYRYIPMAKDFGYRIEEVEVAGEEFSLYNQNGNKLIKIGDSNRTLTGEKSYQITYTLRYVKDRDNKADNFNLNLWFTGWETPVEELETQLILPKSIDWSNVRIFGGPQGSKEDSTEWEHYFTQTVDEEQNTLTFLGKDVPANFGLTAKDDKLPEGYWEGAPDYIDADPSAIVEAHDVDISVSKDHVVSYQERIDFDFSEDVNSYTISIPKNSEEYEIENFVAEDLSVETEEDSDEMNFKLSEKGKKWKGKKTISFSYDLIYYQERGIPDEDHFNTMLCNTVAGLSQHNVSVKVTMPEPVSWSLAWYPFESYRNYPDASVHDFFTFDYPGTDLSPTLVAKADWVPETYSTSIRLEHLPEGYWVGAPDYDKLHMGKYVRLLMLYIIPSLLAAVLWFLFGRDPQLVKPVAFQPPRGLAPAEIGYILDGSVMPKEMMTTLLYFAEKGYLSIREYESERYKFVKQKDIPEGAEWQYADDLFARLFRDHDEVETDSLSQSFRKTVVSCGDTLKKEYAERYGTPIKRSSRVCQILVIILIGLLTFFPLLFTAFMAVGGALMLFKGFDRKRTIGGGRGLIVGGGLLYALTIALTGFIVSLYTIPVFGMLAAASMCLLVFFMIIMPARDEENTKLLGEVLGFREFIKTAEYDRLKLLVDEDPEYFYHILPYAAVFGMDTSWSEKFTSLPVAKPQWYDSYDDRMFRYSDTWARDFMHDTITNSLPAPPSSSSDSGWSSGGGGDYSGGGGGGGGGGAW